MGLLMRRFSVDQDAAFAKLRRISQHENRKLHEIAAELVATRELRRSFSPENR